ncbi:MAG: methyl-accepting chemotaxis protein [Treponema sp.]|nr:methyl-accepting chemotaxis protein [Candidatus Treponema caballi]
MSTKKGMRFSIRAKLLIMILLMLVTATLILSTVTYNRFSETITESVNSQLANIADDLENRIVALNEEEFTKIRVLSKIDYLRDPSHSLQEKQAFLNPILAALGSRYENLAFYDKDGFAITSDGRLMDLHDRAYFSVAFEGNEYVSDPSYSAVIDKILQYYSVPVYDFDNKPIGVLVLLINGNSLLDTIKDIDVGAGMHPSIINRITSTTVANANEGVATENDTEYEVDPDAGIGLVLNHIFEGKTGQEVFEDPAMHIKMVTAYKPIRGTDWSIFAVSLYDFYFSKLATLRFFIFLLLGIILLVSTVLTIVLVGILIKPLNSVKKSITDISSGSADLTKRIEIKSNDEIGDVVNGFNQFTDKLHSIILDLKKSKDELTSSGQTLHASTQETSASITQILANIDSVRNQINTQGMSVNETAGAVNEIASNIVSLEKMIENQSTGVSQASTAIEEMISNIASVNNSVDKMAESFVDLIKSAESGSHLQSEVNAKIENIRTQSATLQEANSAIASIAGQTNLLAMNAAIEAAHAGDAGKGFSVVADEIRKLSETSSSQSKTIGNQLKEIQNSIDTVVDASKQSNAAFEDVSRKIRNTDEIVQQIRSAMVEQSEGSKQINEALHTMNDSTSEVRTASREMSEGNKAILEEVRKLQDATIQMQTSMSEMSAGAGKINDTGKALNDIANDMDQSIRNIGTQVDMFRI